MHNNFTRMMLHLAKAAHYSGDEIYRNHINQLRADLNKIELLREAEANKELVSRN